MSFRDRSPNRLGGGGRFRPDFRPGFGRGRMNDMRNMDDRPRPWKDAERNNSGFDRGNMGGFDNRNTGGFRGPPNNLVDSRPISKDTPRDFGPRGSDKSGRPNATNTRDTASELNKWNEPKPPLVSTNVIPTAVSNNARTNDVEIIVTHKSLTEYAEFIERRLKTVGLSVDLLFPNEEVPLGRVLANIANRGTLFALVVTQLSEEHRSITVNILHGQTQEHRNMPLDDAVPMIVKNFDTYVKGEKTSIMPAAGAVPITAAGLPLGEKHPEAIQNLLNSLMNNRSLTSSQYENVINYLQEKKEQTKPDTIENISPKADVPPNTKDVLQNRIFTLLSDTINSDKSSNMLQSNQPANLSLLKDSPAIKALQNIVQNNLLAQNPVEPFGKPLGSRV